MVRWVLFPSPSPQAVQVIDFDCKLIRLLSGIVRGAYTGLSASMLRQMTCTQTALCLPSDEWRLIPWRFILLSLTDSLTRFGVYDILKERIRSPEGQCNACAINDALMPRRSSDGKTLPLWKLTVAASLAGGMGGIAGNPADILLVRMVRSFLSLFSRDASLRTNEPCVVPDRRLRQASLTTIEVPQLVSDAFVEYSSETRPDPCVQLRRSLPHAFSGGSFLLLQRVDA